MSLLTAVATATADPIFGWTPVEWVFVVVVVLIVAFVLRKFGVL